MNHLTTEDIYAFCLEPSQPPIMGHYQATSETPFGRWRFASGPIVAGFYVLTGQINVFIPPLPTLA